MMSYLGQAETMAK